MRERTYERDGIQYVTRVEETSEGFRAVWRCRKCRKGGKLEHCRSEAEAVGRAHAELFVDHHIPIHVIPRGSVCLSQA
jgi:hypothetical protein